MKAGPPGCVHILVRQIRKLPAIDDVEQRPDQREGAELLRIRLDQRADDFDPGFDLAVALRRAALAGFAHQPLHADRLLPSGQRVVADIRDTARPQLSVEQLHDAGAHRVADPAPQPMQRDHVRFGQRAPPIALRKIGEIALDEPGIGDPGLVSQLAGGGDMRRAEIDAGHLPARVRSGQGQRAEAAAAAELEI